MTTVDLDIVKFTFDVQYPEIQCEIDLEIPHGIPEVGGKTFKLDSFSLSLDDPTITLDVNLHLFGGSITVELDTQDCLIMVSGKIKLDVLVYKHHWDIGPTNIPYMEPLRLLEPSWSTNPAPIDASSLQAEISPLPSSAGIEGQGNSLINDSATQDVLRAVLEFCGAGTLVDDMLDAATSLGQTLQACRQDVLGTEVTKDDSDTTAVIGFGLGTVDAVAAAGGASGGFFFTTDGDWGLFGSASAGLGFITELSGGLTAFVYWPDAGNSGLDNFKGANVSIALDIDAGIGLGGAVSWPETDFNSGQPSSDVPCGLALSLGAGVGFPINFVVLNSKTWVDLNPPLSFPPPHGR